MRAIILIMRAIMDFAIMEAKSIIALGAIMRAIMAEMVCAHSTHGTGAHRVPAHGTARSACTRIGGAADGPPARTTVWGGQDFSVAAKFRAKFDMLTISLEPKFASVGREGHRMVP